MRTSILLHFLFSSNSQDSVVLNRDGSIDQSISVCREYRITFNNDICPLFIQNTFLLIVE
ncbi:hypothetical protein [Bacillus sp. P14.5]|uniref:hypothetical protein n=1 Tax=Bacillus sp. P14.5 TaxID=1983400 RepID=UPI001F0689B5|nr:hypothetical protein [Bacillus sp. P14.5]